MCVRSVYSRTNTLEVKHGGCPKAHGMTVPKLIAQPGNERSTGEAQASCSQGNEAKKAGSSEGRGPTALMRRSSVGNRAGVLSSLQKGSRFKHKYLKCLTLVRKGEDIQRKLREKEEYVSDFKK